MNPIQKHPHIIELSACILNMFVFVFLCPINFLISLGTCSTPKLSKQITSLFLTYKAIQCVSTLHTHQDLLDMLHFLLF